jgi:hypothetical protein
MNNIFDIIASTPNLVMMFTVVLGSKYNVTVGKNEDDIYIYFNKLDYHTKYTGKIDTKDYQDIKDIILSSINNKRIQYIEGYIDAELKEVLVDNCFEIYNENNSYVNLFKVFKCTD